MQFSYTGNNTFFLEQSFFDTQGVLSVAVRSVAPTEIVLEHTVFVTSNVTVTFRGTDFAANDFGVFTDGRITSVEFGGVGVRQATITGIDWDAVSFQTALFTAANTSDYSALSALFSSAGPITIDASAALGPYNQALSWQPFLPDLTQPITFIGSAFDDAVEGTSGDDIINTGLNTRNGDRIIASDGNDRIVFDVPDGTNVSGFTLDYDRISAPVTFDINGTTNSATVTGPGFVDQLENVNDALDFYLGLEGTVGADTYSIQLEPEQVVAVLGGGGADSYSIAADGAIPILDFLFSNATAGLDFNIGTGLIADDGFGFAETVEITGTPDRLIVIGTNLDDRITDGAEDQLVRLFGGDDLFIAGQSGQDSVDGGDGVDTVRFDTLSQGNTTITFQNDISTVIDRRNPDASTALFEVDILETAGGVQLELGKHDGIGLISAANLTTLTELYIAYFDRAADALGLSFWATAFQKNNFSFEDIADLFFTQPETTALYADMSDGDFVTAVYNNVLGRDPDLDGFRFWTTQLADGGSTESGFILDLLAGARATTGSLADVAYIENKTDIGLYFAVIQGQSDLEAANAVMDAFNGTVGSLSTAQALADAAFAEAQSGSTDLLLPVVGGIANPFADIA
ncbi:MAG: DUF4214 domain-containing protein [Marivita sp.]|uniref:DUF4214 domain-containing protein n=1 Tax=Marivita sp. TaxID=2003365 RepID=UPI003EF8C1E6